MANGDTNIDKGRDNSLRVAKVLGAKPTNETTGSELLLGDTQFEWSEKNNVASEGCRGMANNVTINGVSDISVSVSYSSLLTDNAYITIKKAKRSKDKVWVALQKVGGIDWDGLWLVTDFKETFGLDESVKVSFTLMAAGVIAQPEALRPLTAV